MRPEEASGEIALSIDRLSERLKADLSGLREELVRIEEAIRDTCPIARREEP